MPKPKKKRIAKVASEKAIDSLQSSGDTVSSSMLLPRQSRHDELDPYELPDFSNIIVKLRSDLDQETILSRRLRLYELTIQELEALRIKGTRLYMSLANAGELVNPEDIHAYTDGLENLITKLSIEKERLMLDHEPSQSEIKAHDTLPLVKSSESTVASFTAAPSTKVYPDILTAAETAERLRMKLARFYQVYSTLGLRHFREHSQLRFRKASVEAWIESQEQEAAGNSSGLKRGRSQRKKTSDNNPSLSTPVPCEDEPLTFKSVVAPDQSSSYSLSNLDDAINGLVDMLVKRRWLDHVSGPKLGRWLINPKDFQEPSLNWLAGTKTLYSFVVCLYHANILVLEPGTKKKGPVAPQYEPTILKTFLIEGLKLKAGINRTVMKHEAAVKVFRDVMTSYAMGLHGVDRRTDGFLDNIDLYYLESKRDGFSSIKMQFEQSLPREGGKTPISIFSVLDDQVLMFFRDLIVNYPTLLDLEPSL